jgi:tryptophanyl-tRNA synthetase
MAKRVVSGIQPTGNLHLGNYLGAIRNWVRMQDEVAREGGDCLFFLADLHAITVHNDPRELAANVRQMAAALIAAGIDPAKSILFNQAAVPAHAELAWLLAGTARIGWLNRMTQFKDKAGKNREGASVGLFTYPVLMAADVLVYRTTHVPVGEDQKQHLELARDIATKFNLDFGTELFTLPEPMIPPTAARIMSLRDGSAKMSKSDPSEQSRIHLTDDADTIAAKIRKAKTDPEPLPADPAALDGRPEARNLVSIHAALSDETAEAVLARFAGPGFGAFKPALADLLIETLRPITARLAELERDPAELERILAAGAAKARAAAEPVLAGAYAALGLNRETR